MPRNLVHAYLETETGSTVDAMFNPASFEFSTQNSWQSDRVPGKNTPTKRFVGGESGTFNLTLFFDSTATGSSVTSFTDPLLALMQIDTSLPGYDAATNNGRPPWVKFHWGQNLHTFKSVITSARVSFTYFSQEGTPLRASVDMSFEQFEPDANWGPQNPTSGTPHPERTHRVQVGDSLDRLAARYFGDPTKWRDIAVLNEIADPLDLTPGALLSIPERRS